MMYFLLDASVCSDPGLGIILSSTKKILTLIQIIAPILLMVMATVHLINLIRDPDEKKNLKKLQNSALAAVIVFFVPTFLNVLMGMLGSTFTISECWNSLSGTSSSTVYIPISSQSAQSVITDPGSYQSGTQQTTTSSTGYTGTVIEGTAQKVGDVVWDPNDVTKISNLTSSQLIAVLNANGGKATNFIPYASALITAEQKYNVNVFFLLGIEALESGWITSPISRNCNNLGGVRETTSHPSNGCGSNSGGGFGYFNSVNEFIDYHARMLQQNYLTESGAYYHGKTPSGVVVSYCPGCTTWPSTVTTIANDLFSHVKDVI